MSSLYSFFLYFWMLTSLKPLAYLDVSRTSALTDTTSYFDGCGNLMEESGRGLAVEQYMYAHPEVS